MANDRCLIVDAYNLFIRHYVANPTMSKNGDQIGGIVGFYNNLTKLIDKTNARDVYVIWEGGGSVRKKNIYTNYKRQSRPVKLNRYYEDIPDTLQNRNYQIKTLIKFLDNFPVTQIYVEGSEADDVIGYLCKYRFKSRSKVIVSSDHDFYQLLDKLTVLYSPTLKDFVGVYDTDYKLTLPKNFLNQETPLIVNGKEIFISSDYLFGSFTFEETEKENEIFSTTIAKKKQSFTKESIESKMKALGFENVTTDYIDTVFTVHFYYKISN